MAILGFLLICGGILVIAIAWTALMAEGWTGHWSERKVVKQALRNPRRK